MKNSSWLVIGLGLVLVGCGPKPPAEVRPDIAAAYDEFYDVGGGDTGAAKIALAKARKADAENAYTDYLESWIAFRTKDYAGGLELLRTGNKREKCLIYVTEPPPADNIKSLGRIRQVGFETDNFKDFFEIAEDVFVEVRHMGKRVANAEPVNSLSVLNGTGVIRKSYQSEIAYWTEKKSEKDVQRVQTKLDEFTKWYDKFQKDLAEHVGDLMREAGEAAGMTDEELADYAQGKPIQDQGKIAKADAKRIELYEAEVRALRESLKGMPKLD
jgi:HD-GYP domain-containing protein (c-di-GMP phosphodiesterase class II)